MLFFHTYLWASILKCLVRGGNPTKIRINAYFCVKPALYLRKKRILPFFKKVQKKWIFSQKTCIVWKKVLEVFFASRKEVKIKHFYYSYTGNTKLLTFRHKKCPKKGFLCLFLCIECKKVLEVFKILFLLETSELH